MRRRLEFVLTVCCFATLIVAPWIAGVFGVRASESTENRPLLASPDLTLDQVLDSEQFAEIEAFVIDHIPWRQESAAAINEALYTLTGESPVENAFVDDDGMWFAAEDFLQACEGPFAPDAFAATIDGWEEASAGGVDIVLAVAPDKSAIERASFGPRARLANNCQVNREQALRAAFESRDDLLDLWTPLTTRSGDASNDIYFTNDTHWTSWGALTMSQQIIDGFVPGLYAEADVERAGEFTVTGDVTRRLGWERDEVAVRLASVRPDTTTIATVEPTTSPEGVRIYETTATDPAAVIPGTTLIVHDSMGNYAEAVLAPYFEHVEFIHWNDLVSADFLGRVGAADRIVFEIVQRDVAARSQWPFADPAFDQQFRDAVDPS